MWVMLYVLPTPPAATVLTATMLMRKKTTFGWVLGEGAEARQDWEEGDPLVGVSELKGDREEAQSSVRTGQD